MQRDDAIFSAANRTCRTCGGFGWVCEYHRDQRWETRDGTCCGGAGAPCGSCRLEAASAGFVEAGRDAIRAWLRSQEDHYTGVSDFDECYAAGWDDAIAWAAEALEKREDLASEIEARRTTSRVTEEAARELVASIVEARNPEDAAAIRDGIQNRPIPASEAVRAVLRSAPDGFVMAPEEATEEMELAGRAYARSHDPSTFGGIYAAMLSASPLVGEG